MSNQRTYVTATGAVLTDRDIEAIADDVATRDYEPAQVRTRGRPTLGTGPSEVLRVRLDRDLHQALVDRSSADGTTTSAVVRAAIRQYLVSTPPK